MPGCRSSARWDKSRDLLEEGGEDNSVGSRSDMCVARERNASAVVGVDMSGEAVGGEPFDRSSKMPCTFTKRGLHGIRNEMGGAH